MNKRWPMSIVQGSGRWSILLGATAALVAFAGAQAADHGAKPEAVPYIKICTQDGHSYSYIPGSDACASGLALTIGTEDRRSKSLMRSPGAAKLVDPPGRNASDAWSDPGASLRTEQPWGYAALVGGVHNLGAKYSGDSAITSSAAFGALSTCLQAGGIDCTRPKDNPGYFVGIEGEVKAPLLGAGDRIGAGIRYSQGGSSGFGGSLNLGTPDLFGASAATNFDGAAGLELTKAWSVQAGYDHQWSPNLNTSLFAGYANIGVEGDPTNYFATATCGGGAGATGCKSNWGNVGAGVRTSWVPASGLTLSVQTMYNYVWSGFSGNTNGFNGTAPGGRPADAYNFPNQGVWSSYLRINRTFNSGE
jgi:hypothetical protein